MANDKQSCLRIVAFLDGRPGHEKQTLGILRALREKTRLEVCELRIPRKGLWGDILDFVRLVMPGCLKSPDLLSEAHLLIGTGSRTHIPMLQAKKRTGLPVVTCMTPTVLLRHRFDLIFAPEHDGIAAGENVVLTTGPPNCAVISGEKFSNRGLILIGGIDGKSHLWDTGDIEGYIRKIVGRECEVLWTISSSPRTPAETVGRIAEIEREIENVRLFRFEDTEPGWIERQYDECMKVWVTADSMSMVYEALSAGCRVGLLPIRWKRKKNKFRRSEEYLLRKGMVVSFAKWISGGEGWLEQNPLREAHRCAEEILKRWPIKN